MPNDPNSLHYFDRDRLENPYTMAIRSVGDIVQDYDYGKYQKQYLSNNTLSKRIVYILRLRLR